MHRSSESVAGLATALAKAQVELINPEKSLIATVPADGRGAPKQSFRYAPLSSGLDIIRKTLGRHELAVMQTTAFDAPSGLVNLTTLLAHTSGEWISSDWPVCPIADTATPHRMGAALTYARRYALFALVGIAGDDDLDAPDLHAANGISIESTNSSEVVQIERPGLNDAAIGGPGNRQRGKKQEPHTRQPILTPHESSELCTRLLAEITDLRSADTATAWAFNALAMKNKLTSADAQTVEQAFASRMAIFDAAEAADPGSVAPALNISNDKTSPEPSSIHAKTSDDITPKFKVSETNDLLHATHPRRRDKAHLRYVATKACLVCGREPSDPHHLKFAQRTALGRKVSDEFAVPLCRTHHRELHRCGSERKWWSGFGLDPMPVATRLWNETHGMTQPSIANPVERSPMTNRKRNSNGAKTKRAEEPKSDVCVSVHDVAKAD
jgi:ERF superfamily